MDMSTLHESYRGWMIRKLTNRTLTYPAFHHSLTTRNDYELFYLMQVITSSTPNYLIQHYTEPLHLTPATIEALNRDLNYQRMYWEEDIISSHFYGIESTELNDM